MGLGTDASSSPGVIFQGFGSLQGIGKFLPFFLCRTTSYSVQLALPKLGSSLLLHHTVREKIKDISKKKKKKKLLPSSRFNSPS